jgi:phospholipid transport system transporter-binding protein
LANTPNNELCISFEGVDKASSAALSVLLEWMRISRQYSLSIVSVELSAPLRRLANLAELETLLTFKTSPADSA